MKKILLNTITPSHEKVFLMVLFFMFINQFHRLLFLRPIWALLPEHYLLEMLFYLVIPLILMPKTKSLYKDLLFPNVLKLYFWLIFVNIVTCFIYRGQSPLVSIYGWGTFFMILYYPVFMNNNYNSKFWEKILLSLYIFYLICYFCQYFFRMSGVQLFVLDTTMEELEKSSIVRLYADGILSLGVFYCLNKWFTKCGGIYKYLFFVGMIAELLLTTRVRYVALPIACIYFLYKCLGFSTKMFWILILSFGLLVGLLQTETAQDRINYVIEKSERQSFDNESYVRVLLIDYFENQHFTSPAERVLGSGMPKLHPSNPNLALSKYSKQMSALFTDYDFYCFDMGYLGLTWLAGIPFTLLLIILQICIIRKKVPKEYLYLGVWEIYLLISGWFNEEVFGFTNLICQVLALTILTTVIKENKEGKYIVLPDKTVERV